MCDRQLCPCHYCFWWQCQLKPPTMGSIVLDHVFSGPCGLPHWELKMIWAKCNFLFFAFVFYFFGRVIFVIRSCISQWGFWKGGDTKPKTGDWTASSRNQIKLVLIGFYHGNCLWGWLQDLTHVAATLSCSSKEVAAPCCLLLPSRRGSWVDSVPQPLQVTAEHVSVSWNGRYWIEFLIESK